MAPAQSTSNRTAIDPNTANVRIFAAADRGTMIAANSKKTAKIPRKTLQTSGLTGPSAKAGLLVITAQIQPRQDDFDRGASAFHGDFVGVDYEQVGQQERREQQQGETARGDIETEQLRDHGGLLRNGASLGHSCETARSMAQLDGWRGMN